MNLTETQIDAIAQAAYEANRAYVIAEDPEMFSKLHWEDFDEKTKEGYKVGVIGVLEGKGPDHTHELWMKTRLEQGWKFGPVKDASTLEHPCLVPYDQLPPKQRSKDLIFIGVVRLLADVMNPEGREIDDAVYELSKKPKDSHFPALIDALTLKEGEKPEMDRESLSDEELKASIAKAQNPAQSIAAPAEVRHHQEMTAKLLTKAAIAKLKD